MAISADYTMEDLTGFTKAFKVGDVPNFIVMWDNDKKVAELFGTEVLAGKLHHRKRRRTGSKSRRCRGVGLRHGHGIFQATPLTAPGPIYVSDALKKPPLRVAFLMHRLRK